MTDHYASVAPDFPDRLLDKIDALALALAEQPGLGALVEHSPYHKMLVAGTKYILLYRFTRSEIVIARVFHGSQDWLRS